MPYEHSIRRRYRKWYTILLRLYPKPYRERFGEPMEQTFNDLLRERESAERGLFGFVLWAFFETSAGIIGENMTLISRQKNIIRIAVGTGLILLIPLVAMQFSGEWNWSPLDFVFMGTLLFGTGLAFELISRKGGTIAYRVAVGIACAATFLLTWVNAAVGIIGDGPVNLMYFGVPVLLIIGALIARLEPHGMSLALFATALAVLLIPVIALLVWNPPFDPGVAPVFVLNGVFAMLFVGSALLFRRAAHRHN